MEVTRDTVDGVGPDDIDVRLYWDATDPTPSKLPSVTTILKTRSEDKSNLYDWQDRHDGTGDNAFHKHLFWYSGHRGTLCHWYALKTLHPSLQWSADEARSMWALHNVSEMNDPDEYPLVYDARPREVLYSIMKNQHAVASWGDFYDTHPPTFPPEHFETETKHQFERDNAFFVDTFETICTDLGIVPERTIAVERYLFDEVYEYAGQTDLVYEAPDGDIVVADLKTSSGCYMKHKLQSAAYAKAVERDDDIGVDTVDRLEVIRIHPDTGTYAVHTDEPTHDIHVSPYWDESYDALWDEFASLAEQFTYDTDAV